MTSRYFLLISPGSIDGYPPVQYQARLLANAGHAVTVVTMPRHANNTGIAFAHAGVEICCIPGHAAFGGALRRAGAFARALYGARRRAPRNAIEIAYDPIGVFYSDLVPRRPCRRVAHLHELLQQPDGFLEKRLHRSLRRFDTVVVPDSDRAIKTQTALNLPQQPLVIENYPLRAPSPPAKFRSPAGRFEVIYCGSLGFHQKLDVVIRSVLDWPSHADLVLIGNQATATAGALRDLTLQLKLQDRVRFLGWMDTPAAEQRMAKADLGIALLDSSFEQWRTALGASNKRYQFMKAGLPQIGDANSGVPELIEGNGVGACVTSHLPAEVADVVRAYVDDPQRCEDEGSRAFALHQSQFNYERVFPRLLNRIDCW